MNVLQPWNILFFLGWIVFFWIRHVFINRTKNQKKLVRKVDGLEMVLMALMFPATLLLPLLYLFTPLLSFANYLLPFPAHCLGAICLVGSLILFWRSHEDLGENWSVSLEIRDGHELVTNGVYRLIRHPMYSSFWLWAIAQGTLLQNWLAGWSFLVAFALMYFLRLSREEAMMRERFGDQYHEYASRTGRLIPRLRPHKSP